MSEDNKNHPLADLLEKGQGTAIIGDLGTLTYSDLRLMVSNIGEQLASLGIGSGDAVGIVTPNGPEAATVFLSIASFATAAPLNPSYTKDEFKFYLEDLSAKILIVTEDGNRNAIAAATELGIKVLAMRLKKLPGDFSLTLNGEKLKQSPAEKNLHNDISLVLHTSGTTSRPKIVPLTSDNISVSARNISRTLKLTDQDLYLNIMPLFHIHGLIAGVLATLESGGSMFCSAGFDALKFFSLVDDLKPTWFSAVPTMHQAILSRAERNKTIIEDSRLKFIRSSSASLPVAVLKELEIVFKCPVVEAYGMTEAAHQMTSNPLPPLKRKPGTVGLPAGPVVEILTSDGEILGPNQIGEIAIKGANVTKGYQNNPKANNANFTNGWFRTGDQGQIDEEGFLTIKGRLKEIINRGGEKISPKEIDEVLLQHSNISQAVTFAIEHKKLGEDIGAAVVLVDSRKTNEADIKEFLKVQLANFKIPRRIVFLDEIPKGSTGKIQRIGLAEKLGLIK